ncbi:MAG: DUF5131 family protein [Desulfovibrio sp.]|nr:DUF5131 family protein [Desulfovibrio sp.]
MQDIVWNPWHGCHKISPGCKHCYMYRRDAEFGKDSSIVTKTKNFSLPVMKKRDGSYKIPPQSHVYACMTSDFFLEDADPWRDDIWAMIDQRRDLQFTIITKRISRMRVCLPRDWGEGYNHVRICATCENQSTADARIPHLLALSIKHRSLIHEPMLEAIDIEPYLKTGLIERVICGGESGPESRLCDYAWILQTREQCLKYNVDFIFKQTGRLFKKDSRIYVIPRKIQMSQARKANINLYF